MSKGVFLEVRGREALHRLGDFFSNSKDMPLSLIGSLMNIVNTTSLEEEDFLYLMLDGLSFRIVSKEDVVNPLVVRTKVRSVVAEGEHKASQYGVDIRPQFRLAPYLKGEVFLKVTSLDDLESLMYHVTGSVSSVPPLVVTTLTEEGSLYVSFTGLTSSFWSLKEGTFHSLTEDGDTLSFSSVDVWDYTQGRALPMPLISL